MDNIILGLLLLQPRTIYELRKRINAGLNLMYSCSTGSIQAAIKKLLNGGYIAVNSITEGGKHKKLYIVTAEGKRKFELWINTPAEGGAPKNPELAKIYFMGLSERENRVRLIEEHLADLKKTCAELEKICCEGEKTLGEMQGNDIFYYQMKTAEYGRDITKFNIAWYSRLLKETGGN